MVTFVTHRKKSLFLQKISVMTKELQQFPLFSQCSEEMLAELLRWPYKRKVYQEGDMVVRVGDTCDSLMLLTEGTVETRMGSETGREVVIDRLQAPKILAPAFLFSKDNTIPVEVLTITEGVIWYIHREAFFQFMTAHPEVLRAFLGILSDRSHFLSGKVRSFAVKGLRNRVLDYIRQHGAITSVGETAEVLGVARPSLSRLLADLQAEGLVERTKDGGYIRNKRG